MRGLAFSSSRRAVSALTVLEGKNVRCRCANYLDRPTKADGRTGDAQGRTGRTDRRMRRNKFPSELFRRTVKSRRWRALGPRTREHRLPRRTDIRRDPIARRSSTNGRKLARTPWICSVNGQHESRHAVHGERPGGSRSRATRSSCRVEGTIEDMLKSAEKPCVNLFPGKNCAGN